MLSALDDEGARRNAQAHGLASLPLHESPLGSQVIGRFTATAARRTRRAFYRV